MCGDRNISGDVRFAHIGRPDPVPTRRTRTVACVRIVSLLPSATEIVYALGLEDHLVGVTVRVRRAAAGQGGEGGRGQRTRHRGPVPRRDRRHVREQARRRRRTCRPARRRRSPASPRPDPHPGPVPGLRAAVRRRSSEALDYLGCRRRRADPRPALARRGAGHDPRGRPSDRVRRRGRRAGGRPARPPRRGRGGGRRPAAAAGARRRVGRPAVHRRALGPRPGHAPPAASRSRPGTGDPVGRDDLDGAGRRRARTWSSSRRAASTSPARCDQARQRRGPAAEASRSGPSTPTGSSCAPARGWSTGSRRSRRSCTRARCHPRRRGAVARVR